MKDMLPKILEIAKSLNADPYLQRGDFHIYFDKGKARIGMRFDKITSFVANKKNSIAEIQGPKNDGEIPLEYLDIVCDYIKSNGFSHSFGSQMQVESADSKIKLAKAKIDLQDAIEAKDYEKILNYHGIETQKTDDGKLILSHYTAKNNLYTFQDLGVNENDMFLHIHEIQGDADFTFGEATSTGSISRIGGNAKFRCGKITMLENITNIDGNADFSDSDVTSLGKLKTIGKNADFRNSKMTSLGDLTKIGGTGDFINSEISSLNNLQYIGKNAYFKNSKITSLEKLNYIGGSADFERSNVTSLGELREIGGSAHFSNSKVTSLEKLKYIGISLHLQKSDLNSLGDLERVNGDIITSIKYTRTFDLSKRPLDFSRVQVGGKIKTVKN